MMKMLQKTFTGTNPEEVDEKVNEFRKRHSVRFSQHHLAIAYIPDGGCYSLHSETLYYEVNVLPFSLEGEEKKINKSDSGGLIEDGV